MPSEMEHTHAVRPSGELRRALLVTCLSLLAWIPTLAASDMEGEAVPSRAVSGQEIDAALDRVLLRPEYTWRLPRERPVKEDAPVHISSSFWENVREYLRKIATAVVRFLDKIVDWLDEHLGLHRSKPRKDHAGWQSEVQILLFIVLAVAASVLAVFLYRVFKRRKKSLAVEARPLPSAAELLDDSVVADDRPSNEWMDLARELLAQGDLRLALRAMFLAALAHLGALDMLTVAAHKSNGEYARELDRRAREAGSVRQAFEQNTQALERVWYGSHAVSPQTLETYTTNQEQILGYGNITQS
ncbi:MAG: DUF4129 domain-containing protein [Lentisphaerae bacterium]|nr:DUF4129 domain-containing protein [Lentisphaerota bacterium]